MAWLQRFPSMISALAFGYGLGMATPESTIAGARAALDAFRDASAKRPATGPEQAVRRPSVALAAASASRPAPVHAHAHGIHPPAVRAAPPDPLARGEESSELVRLRSIERDRPEGGKIDRTLEPPAYVTSTEALASEDASEEADELGRALSRLQLPDFNVPISRRALSYVRFLTRSDRGRDMFETWLKRSGRYQDLVQQALRARHLPEDLVWVAMIESGFDPQARSPAGAVGIWQFMRSTGEVYGLEVNRFVDERKDPVRATHAAVHHLRDLHQRFGAWELALAAYNMGYLQLLDAIDRAGTTDFNELSRQRVIPTETSNYVPKIVAAALVANNLDRYGFGDVQLYRPVHLSELGVPGGAPLSIVARAAGISKATLRKHNPQLLGDRAPPGGDYALRLPTDLMSRARAALPAMLESEPLLSGDAEVLLGEPPAEPRRRRARHQAWGEDENRLSLLPKPKRRIMRDRPEEASDPLAAMADEFPQRRGERELVMYRVAAGDTLLGVAREFAVDVDDVARDNGLDAEARLREGSLLKLMVKRSTLERWAEKSAKLGRAREPGGADRDRL
jgi:membrane-bound lytic murein transglycosylase D